MKRLFVISLIWLGSAVLWMVLGSTLIFRSGESDAGLRREVHALWGEPMVQRPPSATVTPRGPIADAATPTNLALSSSRIHAELDLEHRQKGLLWFPTYAVKFDGTYRFENTLGERHTVTISFPVQQRNALYDGLQVLDERGKALPLAVSDGAAVFQDVFEPLASKRYRIKYRSRGTGQWSYGISAATHQIENFTMAVDTNVAEIDFSADSLAPTRHHTDRAGWHGVWNFETLVSSASIGIQMPERINPGPLASRITFFAPVGLLFFFFVVTVMADARGRRMRPVSYFFFASGFFAFHLLFAYLVDHIPVWLAFAIASLVSVALVFSYARLVTGRSFAARVMCPAQFIYLVMFSFTFFWQGFTGLAITIGAIGTLFVMMQIVGRREATAPKALDASTGCATPYRCRKLEPAAAGIGPPG